MILLLDIVSPIPEFSVIDDNKIIFSENILKTKEDKLSDKIIPSYQKLDKSMDLTNKLKSLIVTTGPGSYTALRVGISFILGLSFSKKIKIAGLSIQDLLNLKKKENQKLNHGMYVLSSNQQNFICYKFSDTNFKYIKLEKENLNTLDDLNQIDILYYNSLPLKKINKDIRQVKYSIKNNINENLLKINFSKSKIIKPI